MIYQVRANILFNKADEANDFYHDCELALPKGAVINSGQKNFEYSSIQLINNNHDQTPNEPCKLIKHANNL